ncbi:MAG: hypothetical protein M3Z95_02710, partial [Actinomycetota bacterium]|nr:hypothetical protein [Actinomycetota bacterium]
RARCAGLAGQRGGVPGRALAGPDPREIGGPGVRGGRERNRLSAARATSPYVTITPRTTE